MRYSQLFDETFFDEALGTCPVGNLIRLASEAESRDVSGL
ncbi:hypothetical protein V1289_000233 [Bradyrhizobium sp. AZCC 2289]